MSGTEACDPRVKGNFSDESLSLDVPDEEMTAEDSIALFRNQVGGLKYGAGAIISLQVRLQVESSSVSDTPAENFGTEHSIQL